MKKRNFLIAAVAMVSLLSFNNCAKSKDYEYNPTALDYCLEWYRQANVQNNVAMDPFNIAYRLNIYINAIEADPSSESSVKSALFASATIEQPSASAYKISYNGALEPTGDYNRSGWVHIETLGKDLADIGTTWEVTTDPNFQDQYCVETAYGWLEQRLPTGTYTITTSDEKEWAITGNSIYTRIVGTTYNFNWDTAIKIKQTGGNPDYASLTGGTARFEMSTDASGAGNGGKNFEGLYFRYDILTPVLYSVSCPFGQKAGGYERLLIGESTLYYRDTAFFNLGSTLTCQPGCEIKGRVDGIVVSGTINTDGTVIEH